MSPHRSGSGFSCLGAQCSCGLNATQHVSFRVRPISLTDIGHGHGIAEDGERLFHLFQIVWAEDDRSSAAVSRDRHAFVLQLDTVDHVTEVIPHVAQRFDAIRATLELMEAPTEAVQERGSYNLSGCDFTPDEIAAEIRRHVAGFEIDYAPDFRQAIAASWPCRIDDSVARQHWGWQPRFGLQAMVQDMLDKLRAAAT